MKRITIFFISFLTISLPFFCCCIHKNDTIESFHYEIEVTTDNSEDYILYFPVPLLSRDNHPDEGKPTKLMNEMIVEYGTVQYSINDTIYGYAIEIKSNDNFKIMAHREIVNNEIDENDYVFGNFSMQSGDKNYSPYWIYFNSSLNQSIQIDFLCYWRSDPDDSEKYEWELNNYQPITGWQKQEFDRV